MVVQSLFEIKLHVLFGVLSLVCWNEFDCN